MSTHSGEIVLDRAVESIVVGHRHRRDLGDLDALADSIARKGLLQPPTITPDGVLVCGARRLAAIKQLGWRTVGVWVRSNVSTRLEHLLAEQDDNELHKDLDPREAAALYREIKALMAENAARRDAATRFSSDHQPGADGGEKFSPPSLGPRGKAREQAAAMIPGGASFMTLEKIGYLENVAADPDQPEQVRQDAAAALTQIEAGGPVHPAYTRIRAATTPPPEAAGDSEDVDRLAQAALARVRHATTDDADTDVGEGEEPAARWSMRSFVMNTEQLATWWDHYDATELAARLTDEQLDAFFAAAEATARFAEELHAARTQPSEAAGTGRAHLRAI
ncbi:ParB N-terminal domain-containing protein [Kocuria sp. 2SI]|uniref:ParB N-terminal domain-containing protein n=1 Tax=Kocuria sp. 2SI TaxID=2502203 RepID=UPI0010F5D1C1|nr:ParB N-terminal domain-containing protein [Kocuria sp. 2SI]